MTNQFFSIQISRTRLKTRAIMLFIAISIFLSVALPAMAIPQVRAKEFSFYGHDRADWVVLTTPDLAGDPIIWKVLRNPAGAQPHQIKQFNWGLFNDAITPGSWTGDATYDAGVWRNNGAGNAGTYWLKPTELVGFNTSDWGTTGDNLGREGDYDGDGIMDPTIIRITAGQLVWWIKLSTGGTRVVNFGATAANTSTFAFRGADFTGDGRDEFVIARVINANGQAQWFIGDAVTGTQVKFAVFGNFNTQFLINPADYTGDGRADLVTWAAGEVTPANRVWWVYDANTGTTAPPTGLNFGIGDPNFVVNDLPIRGDYDGDGIHDPCVWRPSTATFWCRASSNGTLVVQQWGAVDDTPLGNFFTF